MYVMLCLAFVFKRRIDSTNCNFPSKQTRELSQPTVTVEICLKGLGVNLVNNEQKKDLLYLTISRYFELVYFPLGLVQRLTYFGFQYLRVGRTANQGKLAQSQAIVN